MMRVREITRDYVVVEVSQQLVRQDYDLVVPKLERLMSASGGRLDVLLDLHDFEGWNPASLGDQEHFDVKDRHHSGKVAIVGRRECAEVGCRIARPLFSGEQRFFPITGDKPTGEDRGARQQALEWLRAGR